MTVSNDTHLPPVRRPAAAMLRAPVALCRRLAPPHTKHLLTFHVPVECTVNVEEGVPSPMTRRTTSLLPPRPFSWPPANGIPLPGSDPH